VLINRVVIAEIKPSIQKIIQEVLVNTGFKFMKIKQIRYSRPWNSRWRILLGSLLCVSSYANAAVLNAPADGTFTMHLDRNVLSTYSGYFLSTVWNSEDSDYTNPSNTSEYFSAHIGTTEISSLNQIFNLTDIGNDPGNQPSQRFVKATSANFYLDSETLQGVDSVEGPYGNRIAGAQIGMMGVQGFYAPFWQTACCGLGGGLVNGDFSVVYDSERKTDGRSGWYLANNIYFTMATYDFSNLKLVFTDADNWRLSGDLWMSPENGSMLRGKKLNDVGDFCLGTGSFAGCGQLSQVPLPATSVLFMSGLLGLLTQLGAKRRNILYSIRKNL
jgi:hypothetical protein